MTQIPLSALPAFSDDGRVYRAFGHFIATGAGRLLMVPAALVYGDASQVVPGCPVPIEEVSVLLDSPAFFTAEVAARHPAGRRVLALVEDGWKYDFLTMTPGGTRSVLRISNGNGIVYAEVMRG